MLCKPTTRTSPMLKPQWPALQAPTITSLPGVKTITLVFTTTGLGTTASCSTDLLAKMLSVFGGCRHQPLRLRTTSCNSHARSPGNEAKPVANLTAAGHPDRSESGVTPALVHTPTENDLVC